jgi:hypothetical protein
VSHGFQALIDACIRGQFLNTVKNLYGLPIDGKAGPLLNSDLEITQAAVTYNDAESQRRLAGDVPISFPDLLDINVHVDAFKDGNQAQSILKGIYDEAQEALAAADPAADLLILRLWNAIEANYDKGDKPSMRRKCREWGVVYVPSKGETPSGEDFSVIGEITNAQTKLPLAYAQVTLSNGLVSHTFITDADGMYYIPPVDSGTYDLEVYLSGYVSAIKPLTVVEGEVQELNVLLTPDGPVPPVME